MKKETESALQREQNLQKKVLDERRRKKKKEQEEREEEEEEEEEEKEKLRLEAEKRRPKPGKHSTKDCMSLRREVFYSIL
jgi:hypothetical protein